MEETMLKFTQKLEELVKLGKKNKNTLEYSQVEKHFAGFNLTPDLIETIYAYLEEKGIDMLTITEDDDDMEVDLEDENIEEIDISVPDSVSIEDPVRMYLKEI